MDQSCSARLADSAIDGRIPLSPGAGGNPTRGVGPGRPPSPGGRRMLGDASRGGPNPVPNTIVTGVVRGRGDFRKITMRGSRAFREHLERIVAPSAARPDRARAWTSN